MRLGATSPSSPQLPHPALGKQVQAVRSSLFGERQRVGSSRGSSPIIKKHQPSCAVSLLVQIICRTGIDGRLGKCPTCSGWISLQEDGSVAAATEIAGRCRMCCGRKVLADPRSMLCGKCVLGSNFTFNYECQSCHLVQPIPHPMWIYQPSPDQFGNVTWACHRGCGTYTHWRVVPEDVARIPPGATRSLLRHLFCPLFCFACVLRPMGYYADPLGGGLGETSLAGHLPSLGCLCNPTYMADFGGRKPAFRIETIGSADAATEPPWPLGGLVHSYDVVPGQSILRSRGGGGISGLLRSVSSGRMVQPRQSRIIFVESFDVSFRRCWLPWMMPPRLSVFLCLFWRCMDA